MYWQGKVDGEKSDGLLGEIGAVGLGPARLEQRRDEGQREGCDQVARHEGGLELVMRVAGEVRRVATKLVQSVCSEHFGHENAQLRRME